jgi:hypothetical protein
LCPSLSAVATPSTAGFTSSKLSASEKKFFTDWECPIWLTGASDTERSEGIARIYWNHAMNSFRAMLYTRFVIGEETLSSTSVFNFSHWAIFCNER